MLAGIVLLPSGEKASPTPTGWWYTSPGCSEQDRSDLLAEPWGKKARDNEPQRGGRNTYRHRTPHAALRITTPRAYGHPFGVWAFVFRVPGLRDPRFGSERSTLGWFTRTPLGLARLCLVGPALSAPVSSSGEDHNPEGLVVTKPRVERVGAQRRLFVTLGKKTRD